VTDQGANAHEPLRLHALFRQALATYRATFLRLACVAIVVFLLPALATTALNEWSQRNQDAAARLVVLLAIVGPIEFCITAIGTTSYSGFLDQLVGEDQHGHEPRSLGEVLRSLPYLRLIGASFLVLLTTTVSGLLLVVPGVLMYTLLCLTGPLINIERLGIFAALRRSTRLVWPRFWFVFCAVTVPVIAETGLETGIEYLLHGQPWLEVLIASGVLALTILTIVSLIEVSLAHELVVRDRARLAGTPPVESR